MAAIEQELHERTDNANSVAPSDAMFTSGHALEKPKKRATLSHFFSGARRLSGRRLCSTTHFSVRTFDREGPSSASQKASWRTRTGKRPAISAGVHYLPVSLSCATPRVRPGRLTTPLGCVIAPTTADIRDVMVKCLDSPAVHAVEGGFSDVQPPASGRRVAQLPGRRPSGRRLDRCDARRHPRCISRWLGAETEFPADACSAGVGVRHL